MRVRCTLFLLLLLLLGASSTLAAFDWNSDWYESGTVGIGWGDAVSSVGDVNGDGYSDILVGAPDFGSNPLWSQGRIDLYYGSPSGPGVNPNWQWSPNLAFAQLGWSLAPAGDMNGDGYDDFVVGAPGVSNGHGEEGRLYFFRGSASGPVLVTTAEINEEDARLGHAVAYASDVNGDGYDDILAGAPGWGGYGSPFYIPVQGRAYVFYGGASGPDGTPDWTRSGGDENGDFGWDVAGLGDVNGDGYADVMVGKPQFDPGIIDTNHGAIYCYYGSASGLSTSPDWTQVGALPGDEFGKEIAHAGDFNGDGFADALIGVPDYNSGAGGVYIASGSSSGLGAAGLLRIGYSSSWGGCVSTIGDFNGDGRADFAVGGGVDDDAYIYFGAALLQVEKLIAGSGQFATTIASAGDVNGDGLGDFMIVDPIENAGAGAIRLYLGGREMNYAVALLAGRVGSSNEEFGASVANSGDVDGDGLGDLLIGAPGAAGGGQIKLFYGDIYNMSALPDWTASGGNSGGRFGTSVAFAGDVNGDGYADIVAGDPVLQEVKVFHGSPSGPSSTPDWVHQYPIADCEFGAAVCGGGDLNGDGYADIAVGAPSYDGPGADRGRVRIFFGSANGIQTVGAIDLDGAVGFGRYGSSIAMIGDANGDGYDEIAAGAPGGDGAVLVHYGDPAGIRTTSHTIFLPSDANSGMGSSVAAAGDVNGDGYADFVTGEPLADIVETDSGQINVYMGGPNFNWTAYKHAPPESWPDGKLGAHVAVLGDPDGAGRSYIAASQHSSDGDLVFVRVYEYTGTLVIRASFELPDPGPGLCVAGVGDLDGDGSPELAFGMPATGSNSGTARMHGPFPTGNHLAPSARPELTHANGDPIALRGLFPSGENLRFNVRAWLPAGRSRLRIEWDLGEERQPYSQGGVSPWLASSAHIGGTDLFYVPAISLDAGTRYRWRLRVRSSNPYVPTGPWLTTQPNSDTLYGLRVVDTVTALDDLTPASLVRMESAAPNPFNPSTTLQFTVGTRESVQLQIFDAAGRLVRTLYQGELEPGLHRMRWDGTDERGSGVASGIYHARLSAGGQASGVKVALVK